MTDREFENDLLPVLSGRWKGMVRRYPKAADDFERKAADEANEFIWEALGEFQKDDAIEAARTISRRIQALPEGKTYRWVVGKIREELLRKEINQHPDHWTWQDECHFWHTVASFVREGKEYDEVEVARQYCGKNPTVQERDEAYAVLCRHIDGVRGRLLDRKSVGTSDDAAQAAPYPRDQIEYMKHDRMDWLYRKAQADSVRAGLSELSGLL